MPLPSGVVTFVFTDVVGSTVLARRLGDETFREVLAAQAQLIRAQVAETHGTVVLIEGDGFFVAFEDAANALRFAVRVQQAIATHAFPQDANVRVRIGMHTGAALVDGGTYVGLAVHLAARIASAGHGGQVLASGETVDAAAGRADDDVALVDVGRHLLKDFPDAVALLQVNPRELPDEKFPPLRTRAHVPTNLPATRDVVVGRGEDLARVAKLLVANRLVTLTGVGGTGKTTLALEAARAGLDEYPDGVWLVELAAVTDAFGVERSVAAPLGVRADAARSTSDAVLSALARRRVLLVLDNVEQVLDPVAAFVDRVLDACPYVSVLATSREPIGVRGEQVCRVPPLEEAAAQELFVARARRQDDQFERTDDNASPIAAICERLEGLPLAIELAAAATASLTLDALVAALDDRLAVLTRGPRTATDRQRTLRGAVEWSFELLDAADLSVLAQLAVLRTPFDRSTAARVAVLPGGDVDAAVTRLARASLLEEDDGGRLRMLETIREAAAARAEFDDERAAAQMRHAEHFAALATGDAPPFAAAHDDFLAALDFAHDADLHLERRLARALAPFWARYGHVDTGRSRVRRALESHADAALHAAGANLATFAGDLDDATANARASLKLADAADDAAGRARAYIALCVVASSRGDWAGAIDEAT
ncbi:MAG TPA: adenylate/guanylate cyclase domain-containing protein, partial [Acidimicrobiales bacterium]|nr:adenylate/guanylate cyclase domain-containing protein [Acidimicrobiales bacterium]